MHWLNIAWHWFEVHTGTVNESGPYYGFFSGFGSDIGEIAIIGGLIQVYRHHNCHVRGCARIGRHEYDMDGVKYKLCRKHHPAVDEMRRLTADDFSAHHATKGAHLHDVMDISAREEASVESAVDRREERLADKAPTTVKKASRPVPPSKDPGQRKPAKRRTT